MSYGARNHGGRILAIEPVYLDPVLSGFSGVILGLSEHEGHYTFVEIAAASGNLILQITSPQEGAMRSLFARQLAGYSRLQQLLG